MNSHKFKIGDIVEDTRLAVGCHFRITALEGVSASSGVNLYAMVGVPKPGDTTAGTAVGAVFNAQREDYHKLVIPVGKANFSDYDEKELEEAEKLIKERRRVLQEAKYDQIKASELRVGDKSASGQEIFGLVLSDDKTKVAVYASGIHRIANYAVDQVVSIHKREVK